MKRTAIEALAIYALCLASAAAALSGARSAFGLGLEGAALWGGVLGAAVFVAALSAGVLRLRRRGPGEAAPDSRFWWGAACGIGLGLALGAAVAANAFYVVAANLPAGALSAGLLAGVFLYGVLCARLSFWAASEGAAAFASLEFEEKET